MADIHSRRSKAHFKAWEIEVWGRAIKARLCHHLKNVKDMIHFYRDMYGKGHKR